MPATSIPLLGDWSTRWIVFLVVAVAVGFAIERAAHLLDPSNRDQPLDETPQPGDMSTLNGWDEYVIGNRLEREIASDPEATS